jgi:hypothetical protein
MSVRAACGIQPSRSETLLLGHVHIWLWTETWMNEWLTNSLTSWRKFREKLIVTQLVNYFPVFYGIWKFTMVFTRTRHFIPSPEPDECNSQLQLISVVPILMLSSQTVSSIQDFELKVCMRFSSLPCVLLVPIISQIMHLSPSSCYCLPPWSRHAPPPSCHSSEMTVDLCRDYTALLPTTYVSTLRVIIPTCFVLWRTWPLLSNG